MTLCRIYGEFASEELAELAAGRIRRNVRGIRRITTRRLGKALHPAAGREQYTMLPANLRMMNYATDVLISEMSDAGIPEPNFRRSTELLIVCDTQAAGRVSALMQAAGAVDMRRTDGNGDKNA